MLPDISLLLLPEGAVLPNLSAARNRGPRRPVRRRAPPPDLYHRPRPAPPDMERVLTLGVHGPLELHILLLPPALLAEAHSYQGE